MGPRAGPCHAFLLGHSVVLDGVVPALCCLHPTALPRPLHPHSSCSQSVYRATRGLNRYCAFPLGLLRLWGAGLFQMPGIETRIQWCDTEGERKRWGDSSSKEDARRSLLATLTFNYHLDILLCPSLVHTLPDLPWEMRLGWLELPKATEQPQHLFLYAESMARKHLALEQCRVRVADPLDSWDSAYNS